MSEGSLGAVFVSNVDVAYRGRHRGQEPRDVVEGDDRVMFGGGWMKGERTGRRDDEGVQGRLVGGLI